MPANNPMPTRSDVTLGFVPLGFVPPRMPSGMLFPNKNPAGPRSRLPHKTSIQPVPSALHADPSSANLQPSTDLENDAGDSLLPVEMPPVVE